MDPSAITFILNGKTWRISPNDHDAIRQIPKPEREQLIDLLEAVKLQDRLSAAAVQQVVSRVGAAGVGLAGTNTAANVDSPKPARLGKGDVDELMARLIREERKHKKPGLSQATIYKWAAGVMVAIFVILLLF